MDETVLQIKTICLVSILSGILSVLIPQGRMKSAYLSLCAVVMISAIALPFKNSHKKDFSFFSLDKGKINEELSSNFPQAEVTIFEQAIASALENNLSQEGISAKIGIKAEKVGESILVSEIAVNGSFTEEEKGQIKQFVFERFPDSALSINDVLFDNKEAENE